MSPLTNPDAPLEGRRYAVRVLAGSSRACCVKWRPRGGPTGKFWISSSDTYAVAVQGSNVIEIDSANPSDSAIIRFTLKGENAAPKSCRSVPILIHDHENLHQSSYSEALVMEVQFVAKTERSRSLSPVRHETKDDGSKTNQPPVVPPLGLGGLRIARQEDDNNLLGTARFENTPRDSARGRRSGASKGGDNPPLSARSGGREKNMDSDDRSTKLAKELEDTQALLRQAQEYNRLFTPAPPNVMPPAPPSIHEEMQDAPPLARRGAASPPLSPESPLVGIDDLLDAQRAEKRQQSLDTVFQEILTTKQATVNVLKAASSAASVVVQGKAQLERMEGDTKKLQSSISNVAKKVDGGARKYEEIVSTQRKIESTLNKVMQHVEGETRKLDEVVATQKVLQSNLEKVLALLSLGGAHTTEPATAAKASRTASKRAPKTPTTKEPSAEDPTIVEPLDLEGFDTPSKQSSHPWHAAINLFNKLDRHKSGKVSQLDMLHALRKNRDVAETLGLPSVIHQEDGSRDAFERLFQSIDTDNDKYVTRADIFRAVRDNVVMSPTKTPRTESADPQTPATPNAAAFTAAAAAAAATTAAPARSPRATPAGDSEEKDDDDTPSPPWLANTWTRIEEDKRLGTVTCVADYEVSFDLKILGVVDELSSILRFARGDVEDIANSDRAPAFFLPPNSTSLNVYTATQARAMHAHKMKTDLPIGKEIAVRLRVHGNTCELYVDRERVLIDQNMGERIEGVGEPLVCMASSNHFAAANVELRNVNYYPAPKHRLQGGRI